MYSVHVPFGFAPDRSDSRVPVGAPPGASGKSSLLPSSIFVGRYVPLLICDRSGNLLPLSSNVSVLLLTEKFDPASDIRMMLSPFGFSSRISTSPGDPCPKFLSCTLIFVTLPLTPETLMLEGYGLASVGGEKLSLMVIEPELVNVC